MDKRKSFLTYGLLFFTIIIWAIAWPSSKIALMDMPPLWFSLVRLCIGFLTVFLILLFQKKIRLPQRKDLPFILTIGLLQMACFLIFLNGGLLFVEAGRSAILVYSTPFLVAPIAVLYFGERFTGLKLFGLIFGFIGIVLLFNPWSFNWHNKNILIGNALLLLAAVCWAIAMLHTRYGTWHSPAIQLVPWQLLLASIFVLGACLIINPHPRVAWTGRLAIMALFNGLLATGFAYTAIIFVTQNLPVVTTSLLLLGVPVIGLLSSAWWLGEPLTLTKVVALLFIIIGLTSMALEKSQE